VAEHARINARTSPSVRISTGRRRDLDAEVDAGVLVVESVTLAAR